MGAKQTKFIDDLTQHNGLCFSSLEKANIIVKEVMALNVEIRACTDEKARSKLGGNKRVLLIALLKERSKLQGLIDDYGKKINAFETFIKEKSARWVFKSTLPQAKDFLGKVKTAKKNLDAWMETSKSFVL
jgi:hypothetical protein